MTVYISLLRAVNVGGHNPVKMEALRELFTTLRFRDAATYVQSGNVVFRCSKKDAERGAVHLALQIESAIEKTFGHRPGVILRTASEMRDVVARNPFANRPGIEPNRFMVTFLAAEPSVEARRKALALQVPPEELHVDGRELFTYFPNGFSQSNLSMAKVERALRIVGTARNWNTVIRLLAMAEKLESAL